MQAQLAMRRDPAIVGRTADATLVTQALQA
jgi:hypothetical protein